MYVWKKQALALMESMGMKKYSSDLPAGQIKPSILQLAKGIKQAILSHSPCALLLAIFSDSV